MGFRLTFFLNTVSRLASTVAARNISPAIVPMISACTARSSVWRMIETPSEVSVSRRRSRSTDFTLPLQGYLPLTSGPFTTIARWSIVSSVLQTGRQEILRGREFLPLLSCLSGSEPVTTAVDGCKVLPTLRRVATEAARTSALSDSGLGLKTLDRPVSVVSLNPRYHSINSISKSFQRYGNNGLLTLSFHHSLVQCPSP